MQLTLGQASKQVGVSKPTLSKAISTGKLSATRREDGSWAIDPAELCRYVEANGHRFHPATGNGSRVETQDDTASAAAQVEALRQVEGLLRQELVDVRIDRDRWCAEASAWRDQAQAVTRQLTDQREPERRPWWCRLEARGRRPGAWPEATRPSQPSSHDRGALWP